LLNANNESTVYLTKRIPPINEITMISFTHVAEDVRKNLMVG